MLRKHKHTSIDCEVRVLRTSVDTQNMIPAPGRFPVGENFASSSQGVVVRRYPKELTVFPGVLSARRRLRHDRHKTSGQVW